MRRILLLGVALAALLTVLFVLLHSAGDQTDPAEPREAAPATGPTEEPVEPVPEEAPAEDPTGASIVGVVLAPDRSPVPGATVAALSFEVEWGESLAPVSTVTDEAGRFRIDGLSAGDFGLRASADGIGAGGLPLLRVPEEGEVRVEIRLSPPAAIEGRVVTPDGEPLPDARVTVDEDAPMRRLHHKLHRWWFGSRNEFSAITGPEGRFRLAPLLAGAYDVVVEAAGYLKKEVKTVRAPSSGLTISLAPGGSIRVVASLPGEPRPSQISFDLQPDGRSEKVEVTGLETEFVLPGVPPGEQVLRVRAVGRTEESAGLTVRAGEEIGPVRLDLRTGTLVKGSVQERESGRPVPRAQVELSFVERSGLGYSATREETVTADEGGRFQARLRPGEWTAIPSRDGYALPEDLDPDLDSQDEPFPVGTEPMERVLFLTPGPAALTGFVRYEDGTPVAGATVEVTAAETNEGYGLGGSVKMSAEMEARTGEDGSFRIDTDIAPWCEYSILATGPGGAKAEVEDVRFRKGEREASTSFVLERPDALRGGVRGRVVDERGESVPGAVVRAAGKSTMAGSDGRFAIDGLADGTFRAAYTALGRPTAYSDRFQVPKDGTVQLPDLVLPDRGLTVSGRITGVADEPVSGAWITLWINSSTYSTQTRDDGSYRIEGLALSSANVTVQASARDYRHQEKRLSVEGTARVDMRLLAEVSITGMMRFPGAPPRALTVQYRHETLDSWWNLDVEWDPHTGAFTANRLPAGRRQIRFRAEGYAPGGERTVDAPEVGAVSVGTIVMTRGGRLTGRVVDAAGKPIPGVQVSIRGEFLFTDTLEDGTFLIENTPPGDHVLAVNGLEGREKSPTFPVAIKEGETTRIELAVGE